MKKGLNYFIYFIILFVGIACNIVMAADREDKTETIIARPYSGDIVKDLSNYKQLQCTADSNFKYLKYSLNSGVLSVNFINNAEYELDRVESVTCTYSYDASVKLSERREGTLHLKYIIKPYISDLTDFTFIYGDPTASSVDLFKAYDEFAGLYPIYRLKAITKIVADPNENTTNNKYIDVDCDVATNFDPNTYTSEGKSCVLSLKDTYQSKFGDVFAYFYVEYMDLENNPHVGHFYIKILPNRYTYAEYNASTTCKFSSDWKNSSIQYTKQTDWIVGNKVTLPTCTTKSDSNPLIKFEGWLDVYKTVADGSLLGDVPDAMNPDTCTSYVTFKPGTTITLENHSKEFTHCVSTKNGIALTLMGGTISVPSYGVKQGDVVYFVKNDKINQFQLPNVTSIPFEFNRYGSATFVGWKDSDNNMYSPGTTVPADGKTYFAVYSNNAETINDARRMLIKCLEWETITMSGIDDCVSSNPDIVEAEASGGECHVYGKIYDPNFKYVDVIVTTTDGREFVYKIEVDNTYSSLNEWVDEGIIDLELEDFEVGDGEGNTITINGAAACDEYVVKHSGIKVSNVATYNGFGLYFNQYRAVSKCDSGAVHLALCMDPGRPGPESSGATVYVIDQSFDPTNEFGRVLTHIVRQFVGNDIDKNDSSSTARDTIAAANCAVRLIQYFSTEELASSSDNKTTTYYKNAIASYKAAGEALKAECKDGIEKCTKEKVLKALKSKWTWNNTFILNVVADYLSSYENTKVTTKISEVTSKIKDIKQEWENEKLTLSYDGWLTDFGTDVDFNSLKIDRDCKYLCEDNSCCQLNIKQEDKGYKYEFKVTLTEKNIRKAKSITKEDLPAIVLTANQDKGYKAANVFVLKPKSGNHQRMAIFNLEGSAMRFPFNLSNLKCDLEYSFLQPESPDFDPVLFRALNCCDQVKFRKDEYEEAYKYYCTQYCYSSNFQLYCNPDNLGASDFYDIYSIKEGQIGGSANKSYSCIVDVTPDVGESQEETARKFDYSGNQYKNGGVESKYCAVSCKEDWDLALPAFDSFVGDKSINAGGYFSIDTNMYFNNKRTCFTTFIDYEQYVKDQQDLSEEAMTAYNLYSEYTKVYSVLKASKNSYDITYYTWHWDDWHYCHDKHCTGGYKTECSGEGENRSCSSVCQGWSDCTHKCYEWYSKPHTCTVYELNTDAGGTFDKSTYTSLPSTGLNSKVEQAKDVDGTGSISTYSLGSGTARTVSVYYALHSYYKIGSYAPPETTSSSTSYDGKCCGGGEYSCPYSKAGYDELLKDAWYKDHDVESYISSRANRVKTLTNLISSNAQAMSKCQNFYLVNESTKNQWNAVGPKINAYEGKKLFDNTTIITAGAATSKITSNFEPEATYKYEDEQFMALLSGKDGNSSENFIIPFATENEKYFSGETGCGSDLVVTNKDGVSSALVNAYGEPLKICRGASEVKAYVPAANNIEWDPEVEGSTYTGPGEITLANAVVQFQIPLCITPGASVYEYQGQSDNKKCETSKGVVYQVNYITKSLQNSSFYVNKGHWYLDSITDVKSHGDNKASAVAKVSPAMSLNTSSLFGAEYNTFPISLNTPRNIYQYSYSFVGIGTYPNNKIDGGSTGGRGRIMGTETSVISTNTRKCFYQVYEDVCKCCGDPIIWYTKSGSSVDETEKYLDSAIRPDYFDKSKTDYTKLSSTLGAISSTVSLFDIDGTTNRFIGDNWSLSDTYIFDGKIYKTSKGAELLNQLSFKGETIYNNEGNNIPEYSYILTPSVLAQIRTDDSLYGYSTKSVEAIGNKICFKTGPCSPSSDDAGYFHLGSIFLKKYLANAENKKYSSIINSTKTLGTGACVVTNANKTYDRGCRWVDYRTGNGHYLALK